MTPATISLVVLLVGISAMIIWMIILHQMFKRDTAKFQIVLRETAQAQADLIAEAKAIRGHVRMLRGTPRDELIFPPRPAVGGVRMRKRGGIHETDGSIRRADDPSSQSTPPSSNAPGD